MGDVVDFERARRDRELARITERLIEQAGKQRRFTSKDYHRYGAGFITHYEYARHQLAMNVAAKPNEPRGRITWGFLTWDDVYCKPSLLTRIWRAVCCAIMGLRQRLERRLKHLRSRTDH